MMMQTPAQWAQTEAQARADGLTDAQLFGLAIGCPVHGNAAMDWDDDEVFCYLTHATLTADNDDPYQYGTGVRRTS